MFTATHFVLSNNFGDYSSVSSRSFVLSLLFLSPANQRRNIYHEYYYVLCIIIRIHINVEIYSYPNKEIYLCISFIFVPLVPLPDYSFHQTEIGIVSFQELLLNLFRISYVYLDSLYNRTSTTMKRRTK